MSLSMVACDGRIDPLAEMPEPPIIRPPSETPLEDLPPFSPAEGGLRPLTRRQLEGAFRSALESSELEVAQNLEPDPAPEHRFRFIGELVTASPINEFDVLKLDQAALTSVAEAITEEQLRCTPSSADDACVDDFLARVLESAFRRPPSVDELSDYREIVRDAGEALDFVAGLRFATAAALQSPWFVYLTEIGEGPADARRLNSHEFAARLSFFLWDAPPDEELRDLANRDALDADSIRAQVRRMLADPRAGESARQFFAEWFGYDAIETLAKDSSVYDFDRALGTSMRREMEGLVGDLLAGELTYLDLFTTRRTHLDRRLADFYGVDVSALIPEGSTEQVGRFEAEEEGPGCNADGLDPAFHNLCSEGNTVGSSFNVPAATSIRITVRAYGVRAGDDLPRVALVIDDAEESQTDINGTEASPEELEFNVELSAGTHDIAVRFMNDFYEPPANRDLIIDWINVEAIDGNPDTTVLTEVPPERSGFLARGAFLATYAKAIDTSPTARGLFVRERILCGRVLDPPPTASTELPPRSDSVRTNRERVAAHTTDPTCNFCHRAMDPLGLPLENFDGIGAYRDTDNGATIDASGDLDGVAFDGATEMGEVLRADPRVALCAVRHLYRHAVGREETVDQERLIRAVGEEFAASEGDWTALIEALVLSDLFQMVRVPEDEPVEEEQ